MQRLKSLIKPRMQSILHKNSSSSPNIQNGIPTRFSDKLKNEMSSNGIKLPKINAQKSLSNINMEIATSSRSRIENIYLTRRYRSRLNNSKLRNVSKSMMKNLLFMAKPMSSVELKMIIGKYRQRNSNQCFSSQS